MNDTDEPTTDDPGVATDTPEVPTPELASETLHDLPSSEELVEAAETTATTSETGGDEPASAEAGREEVPVPTEPAVPATPPSNKRWYAIKVQSGREESIKAAVERRVKIEGLEEYFGQIVIPIEKKVTVKDGRRITRKLKKLPGYLMAELEFNDSILYLFRETSGVGDFVGHSPTRDKPPLPMTDDEVRNMLDDGSSGDTAAEGGAPKRGKPAKIVAPAYQKGDRVRVRQGTFADMEGVVKDVAEAKDPSLGYKVMVELTIWGRPTGVEFEPHQLEPV